MIRRAYTLIEVMIVVAIVGILAAIVLGNLNSGPDIAERARRTLDDEGYTAITIDDTGYGGSFNGCSKSDGRSAEFSATNVNGKRIHGVVCCGTFGKGCTVRH